MAKFVEFKNASTPFEGKKIAIDIEKIITIFQDVLKADEGKVTSLWCRENMWTVQEDFDTVLQKIKDAQ